MFNTNFYLSRPVKVKCYGAIGLELRLMYNSNIEALALLRYIALFFLNYRKRPGVIHTRANLFGEKQAKFS